MKQLGTVWPVDFLAQHVWLGQFSRPSLVHSSSNPCTSLMCICYSNSILLSLVFIVCVKMAKHVIKRFSEMAHIIALYTSIIDLMFYHVVAGKCPQTKCLGKKHLCC